MTKEYCVYTDKVYDASEMTKEHIIPLSLGGNNNFCIKVNSEVNKIFGSKIDGKLSQDYLISCLRRKHDLKGHSKISPITKLRNVRLEGSNKPVQLIFQEGFRRIYDLIEKRDLTEEEAVGKKFDIKMNFDQHIRSLFIAKVALATGYFIYGKTFINESDHHSIREYLQFGMHRNKSLVENLNLRFIDEFSKTDCEITNKTTEYFKIIFSELKCSAVKFALCSEHFLVSVGIAGQYIGTINFKANVKKFPNQEKFFGGQVIGIQNGQLKRSSMDFIESSIRNKYLSK